MQTLLMALLIAVLFMVGAFIAGLLFALGAAWAIRILAEGEE